MPTKAGPIAKKQSCKRSAVGIKSADDINVIVEFLEGLLGSLRIWDDLTGFNLEEQIHAKLYSHPKDYFGILGKSWGRD